jgi:hypothetical protein
MTNRQADDLGYLTGQEIRDCENEDELLDWHDELMDLNDSLTSQLAVRAPLATTDRAWVIRTSDKAAAIQTNLRRVERQIVNLGYELPRASFQNITVPAAGPAGRE